MVRPRTLLILGGYGNAGFAIARLLLRETGARLVLAGRHTERAEAAARQLGEQFGNDRVTGRHADAADEAGLRRALEPVDMVVVASSTASGVRAVAEAALRSGADYLDIQYSPTKVRDLRAMAEDITASGRCFITDAGFHPGLPAALVRHVSPMFDVMDRAVVSSLISVSWDLRFSPSTLAEFVEELRDYQPLVFQDGQWRRTGLSGSRKVDFGPPFGVRPCVPMGLEELWQLPELFPALKETGFYMAGFHWFVDWFVLPAAMGSLRLFGTRSASTMARLLHWGLRRFSGPPFGTVLKVEAAGEKSGRRSEVTLVLGHEDAYEFTAVPVVACLLQYLDGSIHRPGLWLMGHLVEPARLVRDMGRLGIRVSTRGRSGPSAAGRSP